MKKILMSLIVASVLIVSFGFVAAKGGFDANGFNARANNFVGTGSSWCLYKGLSEDCLGNYGNDKLVMKWNEAWDECNAAGNNDEDACAGAWLNNEWNGAFPGGSGEVWHLGRIRTRK